MSDRPRLSLVILVPVFNDWDAAAILIEELDRVLLGLPVAPRVLLLDDASTTPPPANGLRRDFRALEKVEILHMRKNLGHQRAIAIGLSHVYEFNRCDAVLVMDGDGEDRPRDVPELLARFERQDRAEIIFAARTKRMEGLIFRTFYWAYRVLHRALTGIQVRVGNFSVLPWGSLERLMAVSELWNHFAAAIFRSKLPYQTIPLPRGKRYAGKSQMSFFALLVHGISAISVFSDVVSARLLAGSVTLIALSAVLIGAVLHVRFNTAMAVPGWATYMVGFLLLLMAQGAMFSTLLVLIIMGNRSGATFLPLRDAHFFRMGVTTVFDRRDLAIPASEGLADMARVLSGKRTA